VVRRSRGCKHQPSFGPHWNPTAVGNDIRAGVTFGFQRIGRAIGAPGRWLYTNDWGWYWISDDSEAQWGWATYHYGRWVVDDDLGWCWVAGDEWSPGWVQWRRGDDAEYIGWAPLPPDEVVVTYRDEPRFWNFVRGRDFIAPRIASVILPIRQYDVFIRQTVIVNRTVLIRDRFAVNPGIAPNIIAKFSGRPLRTFDVRPVVLAGTAQIPGALQVRAQDVRSSNFRAQTTVRQTQNIVRATDRVQAPQPLAAGEQGRLGDNPPRAAQGRPSTTGQAPGAREQQPQGQQPTQRQEGRSKQDPAQTQGRGGVEQRQQAPTERRGAEQREQRQQPSRQGVQPQQAPRTEGRGGTAQRQQAPTERRGAEQRDGSGGPRQAAPQPRGQPGITEGRSGRGAGQAAPQARERSPGASATEGRGGGGAARAAPQGGRGGGPGGATTEGRGGRGPR
jgi:Family of unknown function (DUF6600)